MYGRIALVAVTIAALAACSEQQPQKRNEPAQPPGSPATLPATGSPQPAAAHLIREGVGVGGVELGMTPADVERVLGKAELTNKAGAEVVFMGYDAGEIFGVYFGENRVRMIIAAKKDKTWCTDFDVCLYREGDLAKLKAHHGQNLFRFVDRDGSVTYRLLAKAGDRQIMTEYNPVEERNGIVQVAIMYWTGKIDTSSFD